ncbi:type II toxin-antitoxin system HipA family toxin [Cryobacterium sp. M91]|uniref:type II toxin-antitoxin system HipA family toxin n=1 Tax=Cryobacterium sp. M91 TaxID=2048294 RepID=UPI00130490F3|nr:HipA domain-containing protein [Cryobacterium sp. M91]
MEALDLYLHDRHIGTVRRDRAKHRVVIEWDSAYEGNAPTLTESFGVIPGRAPDAELASNFLGGYTPEGNQRTALAAKRGIDPDDLYAILNEFGGSIAGAITLRDPEESGSYHPDYDELAERTLASRLQQAIDEHDLGARDDSRSMLPGFQPKLLVARFDDVWLEPHGRAHSTHILKPRLQSRPEAIFNEFYSHELARHAGLAQFQSAIRTAGTMNYLAIERFDRHVIGGEVLLHHQEDLAQALGLDWRDGDAKFQDHRLPSRAGRPSARLIGELLGSIPGGGRAAEAWLRQLVYHVAIGNNDAHAKNVALLHLATGTQLTEIYDAVPNLFQEGRIDWNLALSVGGNFDHRRVSVEALTQEALSWGVLPRQLVPTAIEDTLAAIEVAVRAIAPPRLASPGMPERIEWNVSRLRSGAEISKPKK